MLTNRFRLGILFYVLAAAKAIMAGDSQATFEDLLRTQPIPTVIAESRPERFLLRSREAQKEQAVLSLDKAFNTLRNSFSERVFHVLSETYFSRLGMEFRDCDSSGPCFGKLGTAFAGDKAIYRIVIDRRLERLPLFQRIILIHELVHLGQSLTLEERLGPAAHDTLNTLDWRLFTETSAAVVESHLLRMFPVSLFDLELEEGLVVPELATNIQRFVRMARMEDTGIYIRWRNRADYTDLCGELSVPRSEAFLIAYMAANYRQNIVHFSFEECSRKLDEPNCALNTLVEHIVDFSMKTATETVSSRESSKTNR